GASQGDQLGQWPGDALAQAGDELGHDLAATSPVGVSVGSDHALVDAPGGFDLDVDIVGEQGGQPVVLSVGEQVGAGVQHPSRGALITSGNTLGTGPRQPRLQALIAFWMKGRRQSRGTSPG